MVGWSVGMGGIEGWKVSGFAGVRNTTLLDIARFAKAIEARDDREWLRKEG